MDFDASVMTTMFMTAFALTIYHVFVRKTRSYRRGKSDYHRGVPYHANPFKEVINSIDWRHGWENEHDKYEHISDPTESGK